jgi:hypothetical protein
MMDGVEVPMRRNAPPAVVSVLLVVLTMSACTATQAPSSTALGAPGFLLGIWHGMIAPITFIVSLFTDAVRVYAVPNVGRWYDFGFVLGIGGFSGGLFAGSRRRWR